MLQKGTDAPLVVPGQFPWIWQLGKGPVQYNPGTLSVPAVFTSFQKLRLKRKILTQMLFIKAPNYQREFY